MATYGITHFFPGGTKEQYENVLKAVHPDGGASLPAGQLLHLAGPTADGWVVVAVYDTQASWERFRDDVLLEGLPSVENGLPGPPQETTFDVAAFQSAARS